MRAPQSPCSGVAPSVPSPLPPLLSPRAMPQGIHKCVIVSPLAPHFPALCGTRQREDPPPFPDTQHPFLLRANTGRGLGPRAHAQHSWSHSPTCSLFHNRIGDTGASALGRALTVNTTLLSLGCVCVIAHVVCKSTCPIVSHMCQALRAVAVQIIVHAANA